MLQFLRCLWFRMTYLMFLNFCLKFLYALPLTLWILIVTIVIGSLLGALLAWGQLYGDEVIVSISKGYVFVLRCTPPIVLLFMVFYGLPEFLEWWLGLDVNGWSRTVFVITAMTLLYTALQSRKYLNQHT